MGAGLGRFEGSDSDLHAMLKFSPRMDRNTRHISLLGILLLTIVAALVYAPALRNPFVHYDDQNYVTENTHVQAGLTWDTFTWAWTSTEQDNWHPLTWLTHALDCQLYGLNPRGHHVTSLLFHLVNVILLFLVLNRMTGSAGRSLVVAALFALHPYNVESVAWIAERKNVLSTLFFLAGMYAYAWYATKPTLQRYLAVAACFALGLASKPMVITFPFVLLLLDYWPLQRISFGATALSPSKKKSKSPASADIGRPTFEQATFAKLVLEKIPLFALCAGSAIITIVAQQSGGAVRDLVKFPVWMRLENAVYAYGMYLVKLVWPVHLAVYYPYPGMNLQTGQTALTAAVLLAICAATWKYRLARPYLVTGWLWYLGTMIPVIGIIQVGDQAMADRYTYVPMIGIFIAIVWLLAEFADARHVKVQLRVAAVLPILAVLAFLTWRQQSYWNSDYDLWAHTLAVTHNNVIADESLGKALLMMGKADESLPHLQAASLRNPGDATRHANYGANLVQCGRLEDAIVEYTAAVQSTSDRNIQLRCYETLATLNDVLGDFGKVRQNYKDALEVDPSQARAMVQRLSGDVETESSAPRYVQLGILLDEAGQPAGAKKAYQRARQLDPTLDIAKQLLASGGSKP